MCSQKTKKQKQKKQKQKRSDSAFFDYKFSFDDEEIVELFISLRTDWFKAFLVIIFLL